MTFRWRRTPRQSVNLGSSLVVAVVLAVLAVVAAVHGEGFVAFVCGGLAAFNLIVGLIE
jgi:hypothetical protein